MENHANAHVIFVGTHISKSKEISFANIDKLCNSLGCTTGELFEYIKDDNIASCVTNMPKNLNIITKIVTKETSGIVTNSVINNKSDDKKIITNKVINHIKNEDISHEQKQEFEGWFRFFAKYPY